MTGAVSAPARDVMASVRSRRRAHDPRGIADRLTDAYMALFVAAYVGATAFWLLDAELPSQPLRLDDVLVWLPVVLMALMWGVIHHATWQGPVLFSGPDMQWVLSSPLSHRSLVRMRLRRTLIIGAIIGAVGGLAVAIATAAMSDGSLLAACAVAIPSVGAVGVLAVAISWHVERSVRWSVVATRATPLVLVFGGMLAVAVGTGREVPVLWSGPWGWATAPILAVSGASAPGWVIGACLLVLATAAFLALAFWLADRFSEEELWRRAEARSAAAAALFFGDVRTMRGVARRSRTRGSIRGRDARLARLGPPWLAIVSRDLLALRRNPGRLVSAVVLTAGAFVAAVAAAHRPILAIAAFLGLYLAASRLLETIRVEVEQPDAHLLLPWPWGTMLAMHCVLPIAVLTLLGWTGLTVVGLGGFVDPGLVIALGFVTPFGAAAMVTAGAVSAARKPFPMDMMISGADSGALLMLLWLVTGPVLAAIVVSFAFGAMRGGADQGLAGSTMWAVAILLGGAAGFTAWLTSRKPPN
jgi:hypothetical protein